jgi:hypothetical protein
MRVQARVSSEDRLKPVVVFACTPGTIVMPVIGLAAVGVASVISAVSNNDWGAWVVVMTAASVGAILGYMLLTRPPRLTITPDGLEVIELLDAREFGFGDIAGRFALASVEDGDKIVAFALTKEYKRRTRFGLHMLSIRFDYSIGDNYRVSPSDLEALLNERLIEWRRIHGIATG